MLAQNAFRPVRSSEADLHQFQQHVINMQVEFLQVKNKLIVNYLQTQRIQEYGCKATVLSASCTERCSCTPDQTC